MSDAQAIVDRALFILTPPLRENVRLQIEAAISARTKELEERIRDAELALTTWDDGHNSEYWLRHAPTPPTAAGEDMQDKINRLTEQLEEARKSRDATSLQWAGEWKKQYETETRLRSVNAVLVRSLKPFANIALEHDCNHGGADCISAPDLAITPRDVRNARAAIARATEQPASNNGEG